MIVSVLFYSFVVITAIQLVYSIVFSSFIVDKKHPKKINELPVSVIVYAKNEEKNLQKFLPLILKQVYSDFEIVLINDASSDETLETMNTFAKKHSNIKIVNVETVEAFWGNKKYPLTLGIKAAKNEHFLFTEANCKPISKYWISEMSKKFSQEKAIVLGYRTFKKEKSILNLLVRFENLLNAIQFFTYAKLGAPYMGVGANLAYTKEVFFNVNGFINHIQIKSGEAALFIKDAANKKNITFTTAANSFTESSAPKSFKEWFTHKKIDIAIAKHYKFKYKFFLKLFLISKVFFYILAITLFFFCSWKIILPIILIYYIINFLVISFSAKKLMEPTITYLLPFLEIGLLIFYFSIFITNLSSKPNLWK